MEEFAKYQTTPQYRLLNVDFTLGDFKFIYFWEWFHRLWARLIGLVFAAGFIYFLAKRYFKAGMVRPLVVLFLLGGLQGAVGWIMVASGLTGDAVYVKPTRLALHFVFALGLLCYTFWLMLSFKTQASQRVATDALKSFTWLLLGLLVLQLGYGALMAGHKAASAAPTWPTINGSLLAPAGLWQGSHGLVNFIDNKIMVHYIHRGLAYLLVVLLVAYALRLKKLGGLAGRRWWWPVAMVGLQLLLGIASVLGATQIVPNAWGFFEWMAQLHQLGGMCLLLMLIYFLYLTSGGKKELR